jgi:hypothetical protein
MASTYSDLKIELIGTGEQSGTWGTTTNNNLGNAALGEAITGSADVTFASADVTVTLTDTNASQTARNLRLNLVGTTGGARSLILGSGCQIEKLYLINNTCADAITVKNTSGSGIAVAAGKSMFVYNNGTNVVDAVTNLSSLTLGSALPITSGGTGSTSTTYVNLASNVTGTLPVANGGTGATSQTAYAVLAGGTTSTGAYQSIASVGTAGQILTSNGAGALPTFQAAGGGFASGTVMLFAQTAAPTGWTKNTTTGDNSALRVVTGTASTGGSVNFTTAFASQTPTGSVAITAVSGSAGNTTLTTPQIPSHQHRVFPGTNTPFLASPNIDSPLLGPIQTGASSPRPANTAGTGGDGAHSHPFSFSSGSGTFTGNAIDLAVKYVDVIRATKD